MDKQSSHFFSGQPCDLTTCTWPSSIFLRVPMTRDHSGEGWLLCPFHLSVVQSTKSFFFDVAVSDLIQYITPRIWHGQDISKHLVCFLSSFFGMSKSQLCWVRLIELVTDTVSGLFVLLIFLEIQVLFNLTGVDPACMTRAGPRICKKRGPSVKIEGKLADMAPK